MAARIRNLKSAVKRRIRGFRGPSEPQLRGLYAKVKELAYKDSKGEALIDMMAQAKQMEQSGELQAQLTSIVLKTWYTHARQGHVRLIGSHSNTFLDRLNSTSLNIAHSYASDFAGLSMEERRFVRRQIDRVNAVKRTGTNRTEAHRSASNLMRNIFRRMGPLKTYVYLKKLRTIKRQADKRILGALQNPDSGL
ncbi:MAG: hypothetical protein Q7R47_00075 [Candidatus Diapherotrites archaeon]|nr:hypothetical protein [Candidatus Diapherotrites archaeon]